MKRESRMYLYVLLYFLVLLIISIIRNVTKNDNVHNALNVVIIFGFALFFVFLFYAMFYVEISISKSKARMRDLINQKEYELAIKESKERIDKSIFGVLIVNAQYNLLYSYMLAGKHNEANELAFMYNWRGYEKDVYYFKLLLAVYYGNIKKAKEFLKLLNALNNRKYFVQKRLSTEMLNAIEDNSYDPEMFKESKYPIVYDIYKLYNKID